tara:strand:- start:120557 stop:122632 length:2076 start_codon:yes stop_codon:yes gene_type:complete
MPRNHLVNETSPYLLQHADNPVEWYPWGQEALQKARQENKPILLSIGYSACHWCHVMAHESFEDEESAALMNELFVNIKVDREERPDIDKIYQTAQFLLTQRAGGWPLTMFLTPDDHIPFFGGTYFPDRARHGLPAFKDLLQHIAKAYQDKPNEIAKQNQSLQGVLKNIYQSTHTPVSLDQSIHETAKDELLESFDNVHGGFGKAPKFPHPSNIEFLLRYWHSSKQQGKQDTQVLHTAVYTLERMTCGGLFDHVSGGFYRYSVDDYWMIPHFEKMLYDNGPLLDLYSLAYQSTKNNYFKTAAQETAQWIMRDMQSPQGGYYSSLDADSEGTEGKFYVWEQQQLESLLTEKEYAVVKLRFGIERGPNFEDKYHLHEFTSLEECAQELSLDLSECSKLWQQAREKLYSHRVTRVAPSRDEKILTSWNALMIKGMLTASRIFNNNDYFTSAQRALQFIHTDMYQHGRLFATYKDEKAHLNAYLDDYAFLLDAVIEYLQIHWHSLYMQFAIHLAETILTQFEDTDHGGFYFTANDHEPLIQRPKVTSDEATPSGNGIAASALLRLGYLLTEPRYINAAERTLEFASQQITNTPIAHASLLRCSEELNHPPITIIIRGHKNDMKQWQQICQQQCNPGTMIFSIPVDEENLPEGLQCKFSANGETQAYICQGTSCQAPIKHISQLSEALDSHSNSTD